MVQKVLRALVQLGWPMRFLDPLFGGFNPFHPDRRRDPYPSLREQRERAPVHWNPALRLWVLTRHADVQRVLRDPGSSVQRRQSLQPFQWMMRGRHPDFVAMVRTNLLMLDPPDHTRVRGLVSKAFTARAVERLRPRIAALVDELLDRAAQLREIDFVEDFAGPLPVRVIAELLGIPAEDRALFVRWSHDLTALLDPFSGDLRDAERSYLALSDYFRGIFEQRRAAPREDLISALLAAEEQGAMLSEAELFSVCATILTAGHETTTHLLGNAIAALLRCGDERKRFCDDPSLARSAVEEFLRFDSPVHFTDRVTTRPLEIGGQRIEANQLVICHIAAANRDPAVFSDPERLDLGRTENPHLAFSYGQHFCVGAQLARAEAQIALARFVARFPGFDGDPDAGVRNDSITLRGYRRLPLDLGA
jgi:hypothetical protein